MIINHNQPISKKWHPPGFALVATISILSLLVMIGLAMISLSKQTTSAVDLGDHRELARANARMALTQAIAMAQLELGPDQRISATASIFMDDENGVTPDKEIYEVNNPDLQYQYPHLLGTWNSWDTWLSGDDNSDEISATYDRGRTSHFRKFLVSHPKELTSQPLSPQEWLTLARHGYGDLETIRLVGEGSLGSLSADDDKLNPHLNDFVEAPLINAGDNGAYAWCIMGNNQKVSVNLAPHNLGSDVADSSATLSNVTENGLQEKLDPLLADYPLQDDVRRVISVPTADYSSIKGGANPGDRKNSYFKKHFHSYSPFSHSLLVDVRKGGLKKDLNALLELNSLPSDFFGSWHKNEVGTWNKHLPGTIRTGLIDDPAAGYLGKVDGDPDRPGPRYFSEGENYLTQNGEGYSSYTRSVNFPSWLKLHQFYQSYKGNSGNIGAQETPSCQIGQSFVKGASYNKGKPLIHTSMEDRNYFCYGFTRAPVINNLSTEFGLRVSEDGQDGNLGLYVSMNTLISIWNPYNVALNVPKTHTEFHAPSIQYRITRKEDTDDVLKDWTNLFENEEGKQLNIFTNKVIGTEGNEPILFLPGESRIFACQPGSVVHIGGKQSLWVTVDQGYEPMFSGRLREIRGLRITAAEKDDVVCHFRINNKEVVDNIFNFYWQMNMNGNRRQRFSELGFKLVPGNTHQQADDTASIMLTPDEGLEFEERAFNDPISNHELVIGCRLKGGSAYDSDGNEVRDHITKSFVHSKPWNFRVQNNRSTDRQLSMLQYEFFSRADSGNGNSPDFNAQSQTKLFCEPYDGQTGTPYAASLIEIPLAPICSLASLQTFRLDPGRGSYRAGLHHYEATVSNAALGIGNSFPNPHVPSNDIYGYLADSAPDNGLAAQRAGLRRWRSVDAWDMAFLHNDALYDQWFTSGLTEQLSETFAIKRNLADVLGDFAEGAPLPNQHLQPLLGVNKQLLESSLVTGELDATRFQPDAFEKVAQFLVLKGGFNVNSTSVEAWKALFFGLSLQQFKYIDDEGNIQQEGGAEEISKVVISRFSTPRGNLEGKDSSDMSSWNGVRYLTPEQISKLAEECVRQVKLRGPFLNMSDFVNRRLAANTDELALCGALQAAIDWDEYNGHSPKVGDKTSINARFKNKDSMITAADTIDKWTSDDDGDGVIDTLGFAESHLGSRWTGIPGYVTQGDLLKRLGNQLTVRDDSFTVRAYGESRDINGVVMAQAYCEAILTRGIDFVDDRQDPQSATYELFQNNATYGRKIRCISFKWINAFEV